MNQNQLVLLSYFPHMLWICVVEMMPSDHSSQTHSCWTFEPKRFETILWERAPLPSAFPTYWWMGSHLSIWFVDFARCLACWSSSDTSHGHSWLSCFGTYTTYTYTTIQEERGACDRSVWMGIYMFGILHPFRHGFYSQDSNNKDRPTSNAFFRDGFVNFGIPRNDSPPVLWHRCHYIFVHIIFMYFHNSTQFHNSMQFHTIPCIHTHTSIHPYTYTYSYSYTYTYTHIHTHTHTYVHTHTYTCTHTYDTYDIHAYTIHIYIAYTYIPINAANYMHTCVHADMHTCTQGYRHSYLPTCLPAYPPAYMHTCIHACI